MKHYLTTVGRGLQRILGRCGLYNGEPWFLKAVGITTVGRGSWTLWALQRWDVVFSTFLDAVDITTVGRGLQYILGRCGHYNGGTWSSVHSWTLWTFTTVGRGLQRVFRRCGNYNGGTWSSVHSWTLWALQRWDVVFSTFLDVNITTVGRGLQRILGCCGHLQRWDLVFSTFLDAVGITTMGRGLQYILRRCGHYNGGTWSSVPHFGGIKTLSKVIQPTEIGALTFAWNCKRGSFSSGSTSASCLPFITSHIVPSVFLIKEKRRGRELALL